MRHLFIVNPTAGGRDSTRYVSELAAKAFESRQDKYEVYVTKAPLDACNKIKEEAQNPGQLRVYACGGDGTLNECVNGAAGLTHVSVTHFPCGTGNDFVRMFGEDRHRFFELPTLIDGEVRPIDVINCNGRYCINICSVGIDARVGTQVHKYSKIPLLGGPMGYLTSLIVNLFKGINRHLKVKYGDKYFEGSMALVCACNGRYYGGGFNPVPTARPDDGLIDFLIVKGVNIFEFFKMIMAYAKGKFREHPDYITHIQRDSIEILSSDEIVVNLDGEAIYGNEIKIRIIPEGVNFIFPKNMQFFNAGHEKDGE
ncbi:MAG TPA: diacylglycerol kinase family lipid kinase [Clostridiales bacterium]|nr:diacylglycerol kinase family lipid kinase [Clostridiales bacterium]